MYKTKLNFDKLEGNTSAGKMKKSPIPSLSKMLVIHICRQKVLQNCGTGVSPVQGLNRLRAPGKMPVSLSDNVKFSTNKKI